MTVYHARIGRERNRGAPLREQRRIAEGVRQALIQIALQRYEQAAGSGLCHEGAWECAIDGMRSLDVSALVRGMGRHGAEERLEGMPG